MFTFALHHYTWWCKTFDWTQCLLNDGLPSMNSACYYLGYRRPRYTTKLILLQLVTRQMLHSSKKDYHKSVMYNVCGKVVRDNYLKHHLMVKHAKTENSAKCDGVQDSRPKANIDSFELSVNDESSNQITVKEIALLVIQMLMMLLQILSMMMQV